VIIWRHKKSGGLYEIVCGAQFEWNGVHCVVYRNVHSGHVWVRSLAEFHDGRFEELSDSPAQPTEKSEILAR
jgi:hypothetical protein